VISAVPDSMRAFSSAMSQMMFNTLGYGLGAFLPSLAMQWIQTANGWKPFLPEGMENRSKYNLTNSSEEMFIKTHKENNAVLLYYGFILVLMWAVFGLFFMGVTYCVTHRNLVKYAKMDDSKIAADDKIRKESIAAIGLVSGSQIGGIMDPSINGYNDTTVHEEQVLRETARFGSLQVGSIGTGFGGAIVNRIRANTIAKARKATIAKARAATLE